MVWAWGCENGGMRVFWRVLLGLVVAAALVWPADWAVWRLRGGPMGSVEVTRFVVAPLKGGKEEYYPDGSEVVGCSVSGLPEAGVGACWWVRRGRVVMDR